VGTGLELEDFCDESHVERNDSELTEEVDIVDLTMRGLFRMGEFCTRNPQSPFLPLYRPQTRLELERKVWRFDKKRRAFHAPRPRVKCGVFNGTDTSVVPQFAGRKIIGHDVKTASRGGHVLVRLSFVSMSRASTQHWS
jgi:hypothetical protein